MLDDKNNLLKEYIFLVLKPVELFYKIIDNEITIAIYVNTITIENDLLKEFNLLLLLIYFHLECLT